MGPGPGTLFRTAWRFFRRRSLTPGAGANSSADGIGQTDLSRSKEMVAGMRATQGRVGIVLGVGVMGCVGLVFLWGFYGHAAQGPAAGHARNAAAASSGSK